MSLERLQKPEVYFVQSKKSVLVFRLVGLLVSHLSWEEFLSAVRQCNSKKVEPLSSVCLFCNLQTIPGIVNTSFKPVLGTCCDEVSFIKLYIGIGQLPQEVHSIYSMEAKGVKLSRYWLHLLSILPLHLSLRGRWRSSPAYAKDINSIYRSIF